MAQNSDEVEDDNIVTTNIADIFINNGIVNGHLKERVQLWNLESVIIQIPEIIDSTKSTPVGKWGGTPTDMINNIASISLNRIKPYVADILEYDDDTGLAQMDQKWNLQLLHNSCSTSDLLMKSFSSLILSIKVDPYS